MSLTEIQNPDSVRLAIREFDAMGRDAFLTSYGFGPAREYYLQHQGRLYDSKAIAAVAHKYEFPDRGPLSAHDFSGGDATVRRKLEALGFRVVRTADAPGDRELRLYESYSREDVQKIVEPGATYVPKAGTWGLQGFVELRDRPGDFVFFVTIGSKKRDRNYRNAVSRDGILDWETQWRQTVDQPQVKRFIAHDERRNRILLFLRSRDDLPYTYFGPLRYLWHDPTSSEPVFFRWQIIRWDPAVAKRIGVGLTDDERIRSHTLTLVDPPSPSASPPPRRGEGEKKPRAMRGIDYAEREARNRELGKAGEKLVVQREQAMLREHGREDLVQQVEHVSVEQGDGLGYDVLSYTPSGEPKYIEVKTTTGGRTATFFMTAGELEASVRLGAQYYLYRVFEYAATIDAGKVFVLQPPFDGQLHFSPILYRAAFSE